MTRAAARIKAREVEPAVHLPFTRHVTPEVIALSTRALITCIRCEGVSFETADAVDLNDLHGKLNLALRNIADERLALWTHVIRSRNRAYPEGTFRSAFARDLDAAYRAQLLRTELFRNDLILTLVWHPGRDAAERAAAFFARLGKAGRSGAEVDTEALKKLEDVARDLIAALERYGPRRLKLYQREGLVFSEPMEFLHRARRRRAPSDAARAWADRSCALHQPADLRPGGARDPWRGRLALCRHAGAQRIPGFDQARHVRWPLEPSVRADRVPVLRILVEGRRKDGPHPQAEPAAVVERPRGEPDR